ncbi:MAG TPA: MarR family winged helix-turn-helix transcriptional regulator [Hyphomicrobium sp.]|jgi:DNA-binding MarR family transcriptional regulator
MPKHDVVDEIACSCLLSASRRLGRVVTSIFDEELRPFQVKASQFGLLVVIAKAGPVRRTDIGRYADLDPSTLTRNLAVMASNGWIEDVIEGDDGRGDPVRITAKGRHLIDGVAPGWKKAQQRARKFLGDERAASLISLFQAPPPN